MMDEHEIRRLIGDLRRHPEIVIMDTEQTCWPGSWERRKAGRPDPPELREVIQIGAVTVETGRFSILTEYEIVARPKVNPIITDFCAELTGVTQERIDREGVSFAEALDSFMRYVGGRPVLVYNADEDVLRENVEINGLDADIPSFMRIRPMLEACGVDMTEVNSGKIARTLGSEKVYREHDALADITSMADGLAILAETADGPSMAP